MQVLLLVMRKHRQGNAPVLICRSRAAMHRLDAHLRLEVGGSYSLPDSMFVPDIYSVVLGHSLLLVLSNTMTKY